MTDNQALLRRYLCRRAAQGRAMAGPTGLPEVGTVEWAAADGPVMLGAVCVELLRHLDAADLRSAVAARDRRVGRARALREASWAISAAVDWTAASRRPSHADLQRRRAVVGASA